MLGSREIERVDVVRLCTAFTSEKPMKEKKPITASRRSNERGRWASYDKCWDCGAEAGHHCIGDDGKEALDVCSERTLNVVNKVTYRRVHSINGKP